jgi:hypothetical protein
LRDHISSAAATYNTDFNQNLIATVKRREKPKQQYKQQMPLQMQQQPQIQQQKMV